MLTFCHFLSLSVTFCHFWTNFWDVSHPCFVHTNASAWHCDTAFKLFFYQNLWWPLFEVPQPFQAICHCGTASGSGHLQVQSWTLLFELEWELALKFLNWKVRTPCGLKQCIVLWWERRILVRVAFKHEKKGSFECLQKETKMLQKVTKSVYLRPVQKRYKMSCHWLSLFVTFCHLLSLSKKWQLVTKSDKKWQTLWGPRGFEVDTFCHFLSLLVTGCHFLSLSVTFCHFLSLSVTKTSLSKSIIINLSKL